MISLSSCCPSPIFPMQCDVYYASETQDKYGKVFKNWQFDESRSCSFFTIDDTSNNNNFQYDDKKFYRLETGLTGRMQDDIRKSSDGRLFPLTHILITNIRKSENLYFYETNGDWIGEPTVFEISMAQPYIGPFGNVEYFKMYLNRSDTQELNEVAAR